MTPVSLHPETDSREAQLEAAAEVFKALSDPARLRILAHLAKNPQGACCGPEPGVCACDLEAVTGLSQPTVSHHMKCLVAARLVRGQKRGRWMYYQIDPQGFALVKEFLPAIGG